MRLFPEFLIFGILLSTIICASMIEVVGNVLGTFNILDVHRSRILTKIELRLSVIAEEWLAIKCVSV